MESMASLYHLFVITLVITFHQVLAAPKTALIPLATDANTLTVYPWWVEPTMVAISGPYIVGGETRLIVARNDDQTFQLKVSSCKIAGQVLTCGVAAESMVENARCADPSFQKLSTNQALLVYRHYNNGAPRVITFTNVAGSPPTVAWTSPSGWDAGVAVRKMECALLSFWSGTPSRGEVALAYTDATGKAYAGVWRLTVSSTTTTLDKTEIKEIYGSVADLGILAPSGTQSSATTTGSPVTFFVVFIGKALSAYADKVAYVKVVFNSQQVTLSSVSDLIGSEAKLPLDMAVLGSSLAVVAYGHSSGYKIQLCDVSSTSLAPRATSASGTLTTSSIHTAGPVFNMIALQAPTEFPTTNKHFVASYRVASGAGRSKAFAVDMSTTSLEWSGAEVAIHSALTRVRQVATSIHSVGLFFTPPLTSGQADQWSIRLLRPIFAWTRTTGSSSPANAECTLAIACVVDLSGTGLVNTDRVHASSNACGSASGSTAFSPTTAAPSGLTAQPNFAVSSVNAQVTWGVSQAGTWKVCYCLLSSCSSNADFSHEAGVLDIRGPAGSITDGGGGSVFMAGRPFTLRIPGHMLAANDRVRIVSTSINCGSSTSDTSVSILQGLLATTPDTAGGGSATERTWSNLVLRIVASYRVCWCGHSECSASTRFNWLVGSFSVAGPTLIKNGAGATLAPAAGAAFTLELQGTGLSASNRVRVVVEASSCGATGTAAHSSLLEGGLASVPVTAGTAGSTGSLSTSLKWPDLRLHQVATFRVCWCAKDSCTVDGDFIVDAGIVVTGGPTQIENALGNALTAIAGTEFVLQVLGTVLSAGDRIRVVSGAVQCRQSGAASHSTGLLGPLGTTPNLAGSVGKTGNIATSLMWSNLKVVIKGSRRVCWCSALGAACDSDGEFSIEVGTFIIDGPQKVDHKCTYGLDCQLQLSGTKLAATNRMMLIASGSCGNGNAVMASFAGLTNPSTVSSGSTTSSESFAFGTTSIAASGSGFTMCWGHHPSQGTDYNVHLGNFVLHGPSPLSAICTMGLSCRIQVSGNGLEASNMLVILSPGKACGSTSMASFQGMINPQQVVSSGVIFSLGTPVAGTLSSNYKLCWGHNPSALSEVASMSADIGTMTLHGAASVTSKTGASLVAIAAIAFTLEVQGTGLHTDDRIRVVGGDTKCSTTGAGSHLTELVGPLVSGTAPSAGSTGGTSTSLQWSGLKLNRVGSTRVCWCPKEAASCSSDASFSVTAGVFSVQGPSAVVGADGNALVPKAGVAFTLEVTGSSLSAQDRIRIVSVACGSTGAAVSSAHLTGPLASTPGMVSLQGSSGNAATSLKWDGLTLMRAGTYRICWCGTLGSTCDTDAEFSVSGGLLVTGGPGVTGLTVSCTVGLTCSINIAGNGLSPTNHVAVQVSGSSCGQGTAATVSWKGLVNPKMATATALNEFTFGAALEPRKSQNLVLCWSHNPSGMADYNIAVGSFTMIGLDMSYIPVQCTLQKACSLQLTGTAVQGTNRMLVLAANAACGSPGAALASWGGLTNPQLPGGGSDQVYTLGVPVSGESGQTHQLCWAYSPSAHNDYQVVIGALTMHGVNAVAAQCNIFSTCSVDLGDRTTGSTNSLYIISHGACGSPSAIGASFMGIANPKVIANNKYTLGAALSGLVGQGHTLCWGDNPASVVEHSVPVGSFTMIGYTAVAAQCTLSLACNIQLPGSRLASSNGLAILTPGSSCSSSSGAVSFKGAINPKQVAASEDVFHMGVPTTGAPRADYVMCWGSNPGAIKDYAVLMGSLAISGPGKVTDASGGSLSVMAATKFTLEIQGFGLSTNDRVRVISMSTNCGGTSAASHVSALSGPLSSGAKSTVGSTGNAATSLRWPLLSLPKVSQFRVCWCPAGAGSCASDSTFSVEAGKFQMLGPEKVVNVSGALLSPESGTVFTLELMGLGLADGDKIRIVDSGVACGHSGSASHTSHLLSSPPSSVGSVGASNSLASSRRWNGLMLGRVGTYHVCWCSASMLSCTSGADFVVEAGSFALGGPQASAWACTTGVPCSVTLSGSALGRSNALMVVSKGTCGQNDAVLATWPGLVNPQTVSDDSGALYKMGLASGVLLGKGEHILCWGHDPRGVKERHNIVIGGFLLHGLKDQAVNCILGAVCRIQLVGSGFSSSNELKITSTIGSCQSTGLVSLLGVTNPMTSINNFDSYEVGVVIQKAVVGQTYQLCWHHDRNVATGQNLWMPAGTLMFTGPTRVMHSVTGSANFPVLLNASLLLQGVGLAFEDRIRVVAASVECGSPTAAATTKQLKGSSDVAPKAIGQGRAALWSPLEFLTEGSFRVCYCGLRKLHHLQECNTGIHFNVDVGTLSARNLCNGIVCQPRSQCHISGVCQPATGLCTFPAAKSGANCDDADELTWDDHCDGKGNCIGLTEPCGPLPDTPPHANGTPGCDNRTTAMHLDVCELRCNQGYKGNGSFSCLYGSWVGSPNCNPRPCPQEPLRPDGGVVPVGCANRTSGEVCEVSCRKGYNGGVSFTCGATGEWEYKEGWCTPLQCPESSLPGDMYPMEDCSEIILDRSCHVSCAEGYSGQGELTCSSSGVWKGDVSCKPKDCTGSVPSVSNAKSDNQHCHGLPHGETCTAICAEGYETAGAFRCELGQFTEFPACTEQGGTVVETPVVKSALVLQGPVGEDSNWTENVGAAAQAAVANVVGVPVTDVRILGVSITKSGEGSIRRLQGSASGSVKVDFAVLLADNSSSWAVEKGLQDTSVVQAALGEELEARGSALPPEMTVSVEPPKMIEDFPLPEMPTTTTVPASIAKVQEVEADSSSSSDLVLAIVVGATVAICIILLFCVWRKWRKKSRQKEHSGDSNEYHDTTNDSTQKYVMQPESERERWDLEDGEIVDEEDALRRQLQELEETKRSLESRLVTLETLRTRGTEPEDFGSMDAGGWESSGQDKLPQVLADQKTVAPHDASTSFVEDPNDLFENADRNALFSTEERQEVWQAASDEVDGHIGQMDMDGLEVDWADEEFEALSDEEDGLIFNSTRLDGEVMSSEPYKLPSSARVLTPSTQPPSAIRSSSLI